MLIQFKKGAGLYRAGDVASFAKPQDVKWAEECVRRGAAVVVRPVLDDDGNPTRAVAPVEVPAVEEHDVSTADLSSLTKAELVKLAEERGVEVTRGDGQDGDPVKADYIRALEEAGGTAGGNEDPAPFEDLSDEELVELAAELELEVTREDDEEGEPERADYLRVLAEHSEAEASQE